MNKKSTLFFISFLSLFSFLCGPSFAQADIVRHLSNDVQNLDPHYVNTHDEFQVTADLFEGLVTLSDDGRVVAGVAERWEISDDFKTFRFYLRSDARWSNGDQVTADDFVYSFRRALAPYNETSKSEYFYGVFLNAEAIGRGQMPPEALGVKAISKDILEIQLATTTQYFIDRLYHPIFFPVHRKSVERYGENWTHPNYIVSNGAYRLVEKIPLARLDLRRNKYFYDLRKVKSELVSYHVEPDQLAAFRKYRSGHIHTIDSIGLEQIEYVRRSYPEQIRIYPEFKTMFCIFNLHKPSLANRNVRFALSMVIDAQLLNKHIADGFYMSAQSYVPPGLNDYSSQKLLFSSIEYSERVKNAKLLLERLGYSKNKPLSLDLRYNTRQNHEKIAKFIADQWEKSLPVTVNLVQDVQLREHYNTLRQGEFDVVLMGWHANYVDAEGFLILFTSYMENLWNFSNFRNAKIEDLFEKSQQDVKLRRTYLEEIEKIALSEMPAMPLYHPTKIELVSPNIIGWSDNLHGIHLSRYMRIEN